MKSQYKLIHKMDWDILIILDACRYDVFKEIMPKRTIPVNSKSIWTLEWFSKTWKKTYDDVIYISASPYCNRTIKMVDTIDKKKYYSFYGKNHFYNVIDVEGNLNKFTEGYFVNPSCVIEAFESQYIFYPEKKYVLHFIQPHTPFYNYIIKIPRISDTLKILADDMNEKRNIEYRDKKGDLAFWELQWDNPNYEINKSTDYYERLFHALVTASYCHPFEHIKKLYKQNLEFALLWIYNMIYKNEEIFEDKKMVVTSDHGEYVGENGYFGHHNPRNKILTTVPWWTNK